MASLLVVAVVCGYVWLTFSQRRMDQFSSQADGWTHKIESCLEDYGSVLAGLKGLYAASKSVERDEFSSFVKVIHQQKQYPGMVMIGFAQKVHPGDLQPFVEQVRADTSLNPEGYPDFSVKDGKPDEEWIIGTYVEPMAGNETVFGFNLFSEPVRRRAMELARDSGRMVATAPLQPVLDPVRKRPAVLLFLPIYRNSAPVSTVEERRSALTGYVYFVLRTEEFFKSAFLYAGWTRKEGIRIIDTTELGRQVDLWSAGSEPVVETGLGKWVSANRMVQFGTRSWALLFFKKMPSPWSGTEGLILVTLLMAGTAWSILLSGIVYLFSTRHAKAVEIAGQMTLELQQSESRFRMMAESSPLGIFLADRRGDFVYVNPACQRMTGLTGTEALGRGWSNGIHADDRQRVLSGWYECAKEGRSYRNVHRFARRDGSVVWVAVEAAPIRIGGEQEGYVGIVEDITEQKKSEDRLGKINACLLGLGLDSSENIRRLVALCGELLEADWAFYSRFEKGTLHAVGQWSAHPGCPSIDQAEAAVCYDLISKSIPNEVVVIRNLPSTPALKTFIGQMIRCGGLPTGPLCIVYSRDYLLMESDRKLVGIIGSAIGTEELKTQTQEEIRVSTRLQGVIAQLNRLALAGKPIEIFLDQSAQLAAEALKVEYCAVFETAPDKNQAVFKNGVGWAGASPGSLVQEMRSRSMASHTFSKGITISEDLTKENRFEIPPFIREQGIVSCAQMLIGDGQNPFGFLIVGFSQKKIFTDPEVRFLGSFVDVLAMGVRRKQMETEIVRSNKELQQRGRLVQSLLEDLWVSKINLEKAQAELVQVEKMAALGRFSSGIAHEVKNPLGIILGGVEYLERKLRALVGGDSDVQETLRMMKESTLRADSIVRNLLQFARPADLKTEEVDPAELMKNAVAMIQYGASVKNIRIETRFETGLRIFVDKNQMLQVLFNLVSNAVDAMQKRGVLTLLTCRQGDLKAPAESCVMEVRDTGEGISKENMARLFEPFFTTKRDRKGTGLGLSTARTIVEKHNGRLTVESEPGIGTTVRVILPMSRGGEIG